jgi:hypothetical protein
MHIGNVGWNEQMGGVPLDYITGNAASAIWYLGTVAEASQLDGRQSHY